MIRILKESETKREAIFAREDPVGSVEEPVREIIAQVRAKGDEALKRYTKEFDGVDITSSDGTFVPSTPGNLIYRTAKEVYALCGRPFHGLRIVQTNPIPMARGLGSSSACIIAVPRQGCSAEG